MSADLFSNFLGMTLQATGNNNNAWGTILNASALQIVERSIAGNITRTVTGGTLDLSGSAPPSGVHQALDFIQVFSGTLSSNQTVILPNISRIWLLANSAGGASLLFKTPSGNTIQVPTSCGILVSCDGSGNLARLDRDSIGTFVHGIAVPNNALACSGQSLLKTDYPDLYAKIGTTFGSVDSLHFTLPLLTDTGRFLRSTSGSLTVGTYQSNLIGSHSHTVTGAPAVGTLTTDNPGNHTHANTLTDLGHTHPQSFNNTDATTGTGGGAFQVIPTNRVAIPSAVTGITINNAAAGAHTHNVTGSLTAGSLATASVGGAETRPESLAVVISIRY